jgi:hypothetical protein
MRICRDPVLMRSHQPAIVIDPAKTAGATSVLPLTGAVMGISASVKETVTV